MQLRNFYWIRNIDKVKREKQFKTNPKYEQEYLANLKFISFVRTTELHLSQAWNAPFSANMFAWISILTLTFSYSGLLQRQQISKSEI